MSIEVPGCTKSGQKSDLFIKWTLPFYDYIYVLDNYELKSQTYHILRFSLKIILLSPFASILIKIQILKSQWRKKIDLDGKRNLKKKVCFYKDTFELAFSTNHLEKEL